MIESVQTSQGYITIMNERELRKLLDRIEIKYLHQSEPETETLKKVNDTQDSSSSPVQVFKLTAAQK